MPPTIIDWLLLVVPWTTAVAVTIWHFRQDNTNTNTTEDSPS